MSKAFVVDVKQGDAGKVLITLTNPIRYKREEQTYPHEVRIHPRHIGLGVTMEAAERFVKELRSQGWNATAWADRRTATWMFSDVRLRSFSQAELFQEAFVEAYACLIESGKQPRPMFYEDFGDDEDGE